MTLAKRLDAVEDNLTPKEAVIRWMREAHEFGSYERVRPLAHRPARRRLPPHPHAPSRWWARCGPETRECRTSSCDPSSTGCRRTSSSSTSSISRPRCGRSWTRKASTCGWSCSSRRSGRSSRRNTPSTRCASTGSTWIGKHPRPGKVEKSTRALYDEHVASWLPEAEALLVRILSSWQPPSMISRRYFAGEDILFPATRENLSWSLETIANLREMYADSIRAPAGTDDDFRRLRPRHRPRPDDAQTEPGPAPAPEGPAGRHRTGPRSWPSNGSSWPSRRPWRSWASTGRRRRSRNNSRENTALISRLCRRVLGRIQALFRRHIAPQFHFGWASWLERRAVPGQDSDKQAGR